MKLNSLKLTALGLGAAAALMSLPAHAGKTIDAIKARGQLICGVNVGLAGFSAADSNGNWTGLDVDYCKAVAASLLGDATKVKWVPLIITWCPNSSSPVLVWLPLCWPFS